MLAKTAAGSPASASAWIRVGGREAGDDHRSIFGRRSPDPEPRRPGLPATQIASRGGFLRRGSVTILSGVDDDDVDIVLELTRRECRSRTELLPLTASPVFAEVPVATAARPLEVRAGGATVFVLNVERSERF